MELFTEQAASFEEAERKLYKLYGDDCVIYARKRIEKRALFGLKKTHTYEVTAYRTAVAESAIEESADSMIPDEPDPEIRNARYDACERILELNEFSTPYRKRILDAVFSEIGDEELSDAEQLEMKLLAKISDSVRVDTGELSSFPPVFVLLGPTGVGKTTTIAKIAALHGYSGGAHTGKDVHLISIDSYRIGAKAQIDTFANIMQIPVVQIQDRSILNTYLSEHRGADLILIDTIGKSPKDIEIHEEMRHILSGCMESDSECSFCLAVSASMKSSDIRRTIERFSDFPLRSVIITKLDETEMVGNIISLFSEIEIPLLYAATGQRVPQDLLPVTPGLFLRRLQGFSVDLENLCIGDDTDYLGLSHQEKQFLQQQD